MLVFLVNMCTTCSGHSGVTRGGGTALVDTIQGGDTLSKA